MEKPISTQHEEPLVFDKFLEPVQALIEEQNQTLTPHHNEKFTFKNFFRLVIYYLVTSYSSAKILINMLNKDLLPPELKLCKVPYPTFNEAFERFSPRLFKAIFAGLVSSMSLTAIPELAALGTLYCVDGSVFPTLISMHWAQYKTTAKAVKLHLCFELNRMIPVQVIIGNGNSSERDALRKMLVAGVTFITDRGYQCFHLFNDIIKAKANFVCRVKSNLIYTISQTLPVQLPTSVKVLFEEISDQIIKCTNDPCDNKYRLVCFKVAGEYFSLLSNRFDLTTFQIIIIYAYRWQIELTFRFLKRTINGIHLIKHSKDGVSIQFYAMLIVSLLQLKLKQDALLQKKTIQKSK